MNSARDCPRSPQEAEVARKRQELAALEKALVDRELFLANLRAELAGFEGRYLREIGALYAELDEWNARLAEMTAQLMGTPQARAVAADARAQAEESYAASHGEAAKIEEFKPQPELKKLFREVCNQVHPDRAASDADRGVRERLMAEANLAYKRQDAGALLRIVEEYKNRPEAVTGSGTAEDLERVVRQIQSIRRRLDEIEAEIAALTASEIAGLMAKVQGAAARGRALLDDMARGIRMRIENLRDEYEGRSTGLRV